jgi:hypothetical protein
MPESQAQDRADDALTEAIIAWGGRFYAAMREYGTIRSEIRADLSEAVAVGDRPRADRLRRALGFLTMELRKRSHRPYRGEAALLQLTLQYGPRHA